MRCADTVQPPSAPAQYSLMQIRDGFVSTIGNTPLIKLQGVSALTGCTILGMA
jgi:hypothetical protein